jgi:uncharacterized protein YbjT (DUF2867 family)
VVKVLVTGGTGTLGRHLVPRLTSEASVRVLSRRSRHSSDRRIRYVRGDLTTGDGLMEATHAVDVIVHCASDPGRKTWRTDVDGTQRLLEAARRSRTKPHLIYVSIVGVDRHPMKYYRAKRAAEELIEEAELPWTTLRTTQWYELLHHVFTRVTKLGMTFLPKDFYFQPLAASEVAARVARAVTGRPAGLLPDMAGPAVRSVDDLARAWTKAMGRNTRFVHCPVPGRVGRAFRDGINLAPDRAVGRMTWESWLQKNVVAPTEEQAS